MSHPHHARSVARQRRGRRGAQGPGKLRKLPFSPELAGLTPRDRLSELEAYARTRSRTLGSSLAFDARCWEISKSMSRGARVPSRKGHMHLCFDGLGRCSDGSPEPMTPAFAGFARTYVRLCRDLGYDALRQRLVALRYLEKAMAAARVTSVCDLTRAVLDAAVLLVADHYAAAPANAIGYQIESIAIYISTNSLARPTLASWRCRLPAAERHDDRSGKAFKVAREAKLPSAEALDALTRAYGAATQPCDVIVVCVAAIAGAAPGRVNEQLALQEDCEVTRTGRDGVVLTGLRTPGSKGFGDHVKLAARAMAPVVRHAVARLREVTSEGRRIKRWYDEPENETKLFLPPDLEYLRGKPRLTPSELAILLGMRVCGNLDIYVRQHDLVDLAKDAPKSRPAERVSFNAVQSHLLSLVPDLMARAGGRDSHPLLVVRWGTFRRRVRVAPSPCLFEVVDYNRIWLGLRAYKGSKSVFQRLGLDPDGSIILLTHQLRHWLNTLAQEGGASQIDIATWSGRGNERHNAAYDHSTDDQTRRILRDAKKRWP